MPATAYGASGTRRQLELPADLLHLQGVDAEQLAVDLEGRDLVTAHFVPPVFAGGVARVAQAAAGSGW